MSRKFAGVVVLLFTLVFPFAAPAFTVSSATMVCCRTRATCCCRKGAAAGAAITVKPCPCAAQRSTVPLTRNTFLLHGDDAGDTVFPAARVHVGHSAAHRNAHVWWEFQRPPPPAA